MSIEYGPHALTRGIQPEIACILPIVSEVFGEHGWTARVTSATDRKHGTGSLHYIGNAVDLYWENGGADPLAIREILFQRINGFPSSARIPPDYDIVFEGDHFHIEFQPKVPAVEYRAAVVRYLNGE